MRHMLMSGASPKIFDGGSNGVTDLYYTYFVHPSGLGHKYYFTVVWDVVLVYQDDNELHCYLVGWTCGNYATPTPPSTWYYTTGHFAVPKSAIESGSFETSPRLSGYDTNNVHVVINFKTGVLSFKAYSEYYGWNWWGGNKNFKSDAISSSHDFKTIIEPKLIAANAGYKAK